MNTTCLNTTEQKVSGQCNIHLFGGCRGNVTEDYRTFQCMTQHYKTFLLHLPKGRDTKQHRTHLHITLLNKTMQNIHYFRWMQGNITRDYGTQLNNTRQISTGQFLYICRKAEYISEHRITQHLIALQNKTRQSIHFQWMYGYSTQYGITIYNTS